MIYAWICHKENSQNKCTQYRQCFHDISAHQKVSYIILSDTNLGSSVTYHLPNVSHRWGETWTMNTLSIIGRQL